MTISKAILSFLAATLAMPAVHVLAQANVNENESATVYVDGSVGSDSNPGTQALPLKTVQAGTLLAQANNIKSIGTKVIINPGIYREFVNIGGYAKQTSAAMTFQAAQPGTAIIAGSNVITSWTPQVGNPAIYTSTWNYDFGACKNPSSWPATGAPVYRTEMVFVNGVALTQVLAVSDMQPGTFNVDETANVIQIWPDASTNMSTAVIEAATRPQTINMLNLANVVFRGLVFRHAADCLNTSGAMMNNSNNILFDNDQFLWNNWGGLGVSSSNAITVQNTIASHNGGVGLGTATDTNVLYSGNETDYNNWRGAMGSFYDWGQGGLKLMYTHTGSVLNQISYNNQAQGLWFDTDDTNLSASNAILVGNIMPGLQIEKNEGPVSLSNSTLCFNGPGVNMINSTNITLTNNILYSNGGTMYYQGGIFLAGVAGGQKVTNWQTQQQYNLITSNVTMVGNTSADGALGQYAFGTYMVGTDWSTFVSSLSSGSNTWYDPYTLNGFKTPNGKLMNLLGWQGLTGQDLNSVWQVPSSIPSACTAPTSTYPDFAFNSQNSNVLYTMVNGVATVNLLVYSYGYGPVNLSVSGLPAGVTASFSVPSLTSGASVLTLTSSQTSVAQTVPINIFASSGSRVHSDTVNVVVVPHP